MLFKPKVNEEKERIIALIRRRRRQILVHSCLYYKLNTNIISDEEFDKWCKELRELHQKYPQYMKINCYDAAFAKWGGFSGFDLPIGEPAILRVAYRLLNVKQENTRMDDEYKKICKEARTDVSKSVECAPSGK